MARTPGLSANRNAFLDMIAWSEGTSTIPGSDDGYNVIVGSTPEAPDLFTDYANHPDKLVELRPGLASTAAGRYQLLYRYWIVYKSMLNLSDYYPPSQDRVALRQIAECSALEDIDSGDIESAIGKCARIWASLPGDADYGQRTNTLDDLISAYLKAGGTLQ